MGSRGRGRRAALSFGLAVTLLTTVVTVAEAATVTNAWRATIGSGGANGTATIQAYTNGAGSIALRLAKLKAASYLPVTLSKGTCGSVGSTLIKFPAIKTTSSGAAARTSSLSASQMTLIKAATAGGRRIAIRVGSSTTGGVKCGLFAALAVPPYVAATIAVGRDPQPVTVTPDSVWVGNYWDGTLSRVDPASNNALSVITLGGDSEVLAPFQLAFSDGSLWVGVDEFESTGKTVTGTSVRRIDPGSGQSLATIKLGKSIDGIAAGGGAVWVSDFEDGTVYRLDPATNQLAATIKLARGTVGIAYDFGSVWVGNEQTGTVTRIDPATNQATATIATVGTAEGLTSGAGAVWVANWGSDGLPDGVVSRIDPATNQVVRTITVGTNPFAIAFGGGYAWVALSAEPTIVRVDPATNTVGARVSTGTVVVGPDGKVVGIWDIAASDHAVWAVQSVPAPDSSSPPPKGSVVRVNF